MFYYYMSLQNIHQKPANGKSANDKGKMHGALPIFEISFYWAVWIPLLSYSMYAVWIASYGLCDKFFPWSKLILKCFVFP